MSAKLILPWPLPELNPNVKTFWAVESQAITDTQWYVLAIMRDQGFTLPDFQLYKVSIIFFPPRLKRVRDLDNLIRCQKPVLDYIFNYHDKDDSQIHEFYRVRWGAAVDGGRVGLEFSEFIQGDLIDAAEWIRI